MRSGYALGTMKLSTEEFAKKYWQNEMIGQYHTMDIEDGENEGQQLMINNIGACWEIASEARRTATRAEQRYLSSPESLWESRLWRIMRDSKRTNIIAVISILLSVVAIFLKSREKKQ